MCSRRFRLLVWYTVAAGLTKTAAAAPRLSEAQATEVLERYLRNAGDSRESTQRPVSFEIEASLPKLRKSGTMHGLKVFVSAGRVVYTQLQFVGDELVKTAVIARFLKAESSQSASNPALAISRRQYAFHFAGTADYNGRTAVIFRTEPKSRRVGLFRGEFWIDSETAQPLREWGQFVKSPSPLISGISFVRDYELSVTESRPRRIILRMKAVLVGPVELTVWLQDSVVTG